MEYEDGFSQSSLDCIPAYNGWGEESDIFSLIGDSGLSLACTSKVSVHSGAKSAYPLGSPYQTLHNLSTAVTSWIPGRNSKEIKTNTTPAAAETASGVLVGYPSSTVS